jgi:thiamine pyrophosphate-dependent acetolactate synthase large subunit-like protein
VAAKSKTPQKARTAPTGAHVLVSQLQSLGVEVVFGIPGIHNLAIFDALRDSSVRVVLVRHEQTAVYAADGYARATGRLGVAITTTGPGAANTAGAMGEARASRSPLLHISTQIASAALAGRTGRFGLHESPHQRELMDAVSVWSASVARADAIPSMIHRAAREAFSGRRGPVFVEIPFDFLSEPLTWRAMEPFAPAAFLPDARSIERAAAVLNEAKRPVIWAGGGAISSGAGGSLAKIAEAIDAPVVTSYAAKGILARDHELLAGFPSHQPEITKLIASSDAALIVGSDLDGMNTQAWRLPFPRPRVNVNALAEDARRNYAADVVIEADAREALDGAARRLATARAAADRTVRARAGMRAPYEFVRALEDVLPPDAVLVADMAIPGYWAAGYYRPHGPRSFAYPVGWGTLGFALPAAIGAAASGRRTVVVCGDAGLAYALGELGTAAQENLDVTVVVVNDEGYGMLRYDEKERFKRTFAADLRAPDHVMLAKSFGIPGKRVTEAQFAATLRAAIKRRGPSLIEIQARWEPPLTTSPRWPLKDKPEARP